jgi:AraC-like DNA-binding protein
MNRQILSQSRYRPLQPAVDSDSNALIGYRETAPSDPLQPYVYCYWTLRSKTATQTAFAYRVVADGCIDLLINCRRFERLVIAGTADTAAIVEFKDAVDYFGIRFLPACFRYFFALPVNEIVNNMLPCETVWGNRLNEFEARLFAARSTRERITLTESFLLRQLLTAGKPPDRRVLAALEQIYRCGGHIPIETGLADAISPRQLRRLFEQHIGVSPKTFARIVRFQAVLRAVRCAPDQSWGRHCCDFGYYDQAHFIREFEDFFGLPPTAVKLPQI